MSRFSLVTPFGWVKELDGLWNLSPNGSFARANLPIAPWRNVTGIAPSVNYLSGPNLYWVGGSAGYTFNQFGLFQAVLVRGYSYPTIGLPDFQRVSAICGVTGGYLMVYNGMVLHHEDRRIHTRCCIPTRACRPRVTPCRACATARTTLTASPMPARRSG